jgi:hypothetical protein
LESDAVEADSSFAEDKSALHSTTVTVLKTTTQVDCDAFGVFRAARDISVGEIVLVEESGLTCPIDAHCYTAAASVAARAAADRAPPPHRRWVPHPRDGGRMVCDVTALRRERGWMIQCGMATAGALVDAVRAMFSSQLFGDGPNTCAPQWVAGLMAQHLPELLAHPTVSSVPSMVDDLLTAAPVPLSQPGVGEHVAAHIKMVEVQARCILEPLQPYLLLVRDSAQAVTLLEAKPAALGSLEYAAAALRAWQLASVEQLSALISALYLSATRVHVPALPDRAAWFPTLARLSHECRPTCAVAFLDAPWSHGSAAHMAATHVQLADPIHRQLVSSANDTKLSLQSIVSVPSIMILTAQRSIRKDEVLTASRLDAATTMMTCAQRRAVLASKHLFLCTCRWCTTAPDVARAFNCPKCERGHGVVCPVGDGSRLDGWQCMQCGFRPDTAAIDEFQYREVQLTRVKADKAKGLAALIGDAAVHFTHAVVVRKLDDWAESAWREQNAELCCGVLEALIKCCDRAGAGHDEDLLAIADGAVVSGGRAARRRDRSSQGDVNKAQYLEFLGKVQHALGNAHTAQDCYRQALAARGAAGGALTFWYQATQFMAEDKTLADFMDSK